MMSSKGKPLALRPPVEARKWLEIGRKAGFEMSEIVTKCMMKVDDGMTEVERVVRALVESRTAELEGLLPPVEARSPGRPPTHGAYSKANGSDGKHPVKLTT